MPKVQIQPYYGGSGRYLYNLNSQDQTVSVIDCSTNTVATTITLTAAKSFCSLFYRAVDQCVYVLGTSFYEKIDANESSGTLNTSIGTGATALASPVNAHYLPRPLDLLVSGNTAGLVLSMTDINNATPNITKIASADGKQRGNITFLQPLGMYNVFLHPSISAIQFGGISGGEQFEFLDIVRREGPHYSNYPFDFVKSNYTQHPSLGADALFTYVFGNFVLHQTESTAYISWNDFGATSPLVIRFIQSIGIGDRVFYEYVGNKRLFVLGKGSLNIPVLDVSSRANLGTILGTISRSAYKATNEVGAGDCQHNPYNNLVYVQASATTSSTSGVNKIHVYNPALAVASMYQTSITTGEIISTLRHSNYSLNTMCFNRTKYREAPNVTV